MTCRKSNRLPALFVAWVLLALLPGGDLLDGSSARAASSTAPEFVGISHWINSRPLTMRQLRGRGKVVLIDFWAYSCINCLRSLPHVEHWYQKYKDKGLVVIGVHSPEFDFERNRSNVTAAVERLGIHYPVAQDNQLATWNAWNNRFWPAEYLVDPHGNVVLHHYGEGHYKEMEDAIRKLLSLPPLSTTDNGMGKLALIGSPEMYFGLRREKYLANAIGPSESARDYRAPDTIPLNRFALSGRWKMTPEYAELAGDSGEIRLHFKSGKLHMVASSKHPATLDVIVDGKPQPPVTVQASKLYTLFDSDDYRDHVVTIKIPKAGFRAFTFTFG